MPLKAHLYDDCNENTPLDVLHLLSLIKWASSNMIRFHLTKSDDNTSFYEGKLFNNETTFSYSTLNSTGMQTWKWKRRYKLPPNGGRGVWELLSYLLFINSFTMVYFISLFASSERAGREREREKTEVFLSFFSLLASLLAFSLWAFLDFSWK